ncbi:MAG TPA: M20/M25/M40 family metallo-hydrolase [Terriglobales bacterium]|jgi:acetylornithine deacetylase/succinyl-diaminopimelate desuccinylase-like protein
MKGPRQPTLDAEEWAGIGSAGAYRSACTRLAAWERWIQQQQLAVTGVAAPTGYEALRAEWMSEAWRALGLETQLDEAGNVLGFHAGEAGARGVVAITAHLDTAFPAGTQVRPERRNGRLWGPGICDNGAGLAALLALARLLHEKRWRPRAPVLLVANVGEEGEGDLKGMRHLFSRQSRWAKEIAWTLVLDGPGVHQITSAALPSLRLRVGLEGQGGHSWSDVGRASANSAAVRVGAALLAQVEPKAGQWGCNIGLLQGGSAVNAIAARAEMKLDLRAREPRRLLELEQAVRRAVAQGVEQENAAALSGRVRARMETIGERPGGSLPEDAQILRLVRQVDAALGIVSQAQCASTDANIPIAQGRQALRLGAGGKAGGIHTLQEWYDPGGRTLALRRILWVAWALSRTGIEDDGRARRRSA